jgi:hypothetical protein
VKRLEKLDIPYAIVGGMAVYLHGHEQCTGDVDLLVTADGLGAFRDHFVPGKYHAVPQRSRRFLDRKNDVQVGFVVTGQFPRDGKPGPVAFPHPAEVSETINEFRVVDLTTLIRLKLAARRYQDLADVSSVIREKHLDESFAECLHPSLRDNYVKCLEEKRREDNFES